jgi:hypothetical protein
VVAGRPGVRLVPGARGRARQMNAGARGAAGDVLLFLHADTWLPDGATALIEGALADPRWSAAASTCASTVVGT